MGINDTRARLVAALFGVATVAVVVLVALHHGHDDSAPTKETSAARDVRVTGDSLEDSVRGFHDGAHAYPETVTLSTGRIRATGVDSSTLVEDAGVRKGVALDWYVDYPDLQYTPEEKRTTVGFAYCVSKGGYSKVSTSDRFGQVVIGPIKRACPAVPSRAEATTADVAATREALSAALDDWIRHPGNGGHYPRTAKLEAGSAGDHLRIVLDTPDAGSSTTESPKVKIGVALGWYTDRALDKKQIKTRNDRLVPSTGDGRRGDGYSFCVDNGTEFRIVVTDRAGTLMSEGDGMCPALPKRH